MGQPGELATLALVDANSARLLRTLSLHGPTPAPQLSALLHLPSGTIDELLDHATLLGVVSTDCRKRYLVEPAALEDVIRANRARLLGEAA